MFTRTEALDFALERNLKGVNFVWRRGGTLQVFWQEGYPTCLGKADKPFDVSEEGSLAEALQGRGDGWFVSAKTNGAWYWHFGLEDNIPIPHEE